MFRRNPIPVTFMTPKSFLRFSTQAQQETSIAPLPLGTISPKQKNIRRKEIEDMLTKWRLKVGLEFHVQIDSKYKMFSSKFNFKLINLLGVTSYFFL